MARIKHERMKDLKEKMKSKKREQDAVKMAQERALETERKDEERRKDIIRKEHLRKE